MAADAARTIHHADHCGSLLRPQELREARRLASLGRMSAEALREIEDKAILRVLDRQREAGLKIYSDGEYRRKVWHEALVSAIDGVVDAGPDFERFPLMRTVDLKENPELASINPMVTGKLRAKGRIAAHERSFLAQHAPGAFKITLPSPAMVTRKWLAGAAGRAAYPSYEALIQDVALIQAAEAKALVEEGVTYVQLDAPAYTRFMIRDRIDEMRRDGVDPEQELAAVVAAENTILRAAKRLGVTVAVHICHGTYFLDGRGAAGGPAVNYDPALTARLYRELEADTFLVEYTDRGGGADSLKDAPKDKVFALGILNIRDPRLEAADDLTRKIDAAARYVPLANLALCPNCGFSGASAGAWISEDDQKRKLELLVGTAARIWG
jgi:5-methyltetrahydropteroyltriglutamate--homocysteine methyltransferase